MGETEFGLVLPRSSGFQSRRFMAENDANADDLLKPSGEGESEANEFVRYTEEVRRMIAHENHLTNHRMTWFGVIQGIMVVVAGKSMEAYPLLGLIPAVAGFLFAYSYGLACEGSETAKQDLLKGWREVKQAREAGPPSLPLVAPVKGHDGGGDADPDRDMLPWRLVPRTTMVLWFVFAFLCVVKLAMEPSCV